MKPWFAEYCALIGLQEAQLLSQGPTLETLRQLHRAQGLSIPFENFDVLCGLNAPEIGEEDVVDKLVRRQRGGYCFEQNSLFRLVLDDLGFSAFNIVGRMHYGRADGPGPRCHGVVGVTLRDGIWLCDVGFNGTGMFEPIPLRSNEELSSCGDVYRWTPTPRIGWLLERKLGSRWLELYSISPEEAIPIDYLHGNFFTAHYPKSPFKHITMFGMSCKSHRFFVRGTSLIEHRPGEDSERVTPFASPQALLDFIECHSKGAFRLNPTLKVTLQRTLEEKWTSMQRFGVPSTSRSRL